MKENYLKYSNENELAIKILGDEDFKRMTKYIGWLKYDSIGEFVHFEIVDWSKTLSKFSHCKKHIYKIRLLEFRFPSGLSFFRSVRVAIFNSNFFDLLYELRKGLIEHLFEIEHDFNRLINYHNNFLTFVNSPFGVQDNYLSLIYVSEALIEIKRQRIQKDEFQNMDNSFSNAIDKNESSAPNEEIILDFEISKRSSISDYKKIPFSLRSNDSINILQDILRELDSVGLINDQNQFIKPFTQVGTSIHGKAIFNADKIAMVFLIEFLILKSVVIKPTNRSILMAEFFAKIDGASLLPKSITNDASKMGFTKKDSDMRYLSVKEFLSKTTNSDILAVYDILSKHIR